MDRMMPIHTGDSKLLLQVYWVKDSLPHLEATSQKHSETMFNEATKCTIACQAGHINELMTLVKSPERHPHNGFQIERVTHMGRKHPP